MEKALYDYSNTAHEKIDCINFAKFCLYSVNTVPVCKICRLRLYCKKNKKTNKQKKKQNDVRIFILDQFLLYMRRTVNMFDSLFL